VHHSGGMDAATVCSAEPVVLAENHSILLRAEFLCTVVFVVHCCIGCEPVVFSVDCWLAVSKEQRVSGL
jgi:hypothetical protein